MPKITNRTTGITQTVTAEELKTIQENELTRDLYDISHSKEPEEVTKEKADKDSKDSKSHKGH